MENIFTGTEASILALPNPQLGDIAHATDTEHFYRYAESGWQDVTNEIGMNLNMSLYDMNKQIVAQLPALEDFSEAIAAIDTFVVDTLNTHYMLYGKEISYFTILQRCMGYTETVGEAVVDCLKNVGLIKSIDLTANKDAFEIWVMIDDNATCLYLFPYDSGIVKVGG